MNVRDDAPPCVRVFVPTCRRPQLLPRALHSLLAKLKAAYPDLPNARWVALRLLAGDDHLAAALREGTLGNLRAGVALEPAAAT